MQIKILGDRPRRDLDNILNSFTIEEIVSEYNNLFNVPMLPIEGREFDANYRNNDLAIHFHKHLFSLVKKSY